MRTQGAWIFGLGVRRRCWRGVRSRRSTARSTTPSMMSVSSTRRRRRPRGRPSRRFKKAGLGARVTAALQAADVHGVRVDAGPDGVTLVGRVARPADKARAVHIAQDTLGPGKAVRSRLTVGNP